MALNAGQVLAAKGFHAPGAEIDAVVEVETAAGHVPLGSVYRASQDGVPLLVTLVDDAISRNMELRNRLTSEVARAQELQIGGLLPTYGSFLHGGNLVIVRAAPRGSSLRDLLERAGKLPPDYVVTLCNKLCYPLASMNRVMVHGCITLDTVYIEAPDSIQLSGAGAGPFVAQTSTFSQQLAAGRLPTIAPEQIESGELTIATDAFAVGALLLELLTGKPLAHAGQPVGALGLFGPLPLVNFMRRVTDPDPAKRFDDLIQLFGAFDEATEGISPPPPAQPGTSAPKPEDSMFGLSGLDKTAIEARLGELDEHQGTRTTRPPPKPEQAASSAGASDSFMGIRGLSDDQLSSRLQGLDGKEAPATAKAKPPPKPPPKSPDKAPSKNEKPAPPKPKPKPAAESAGGLEVDWGAVAQPAAAAPSSATAGPRKPAPPSFAPTPEAQPAAKSSSRGFWIGVVVLMLGAAGAWYYFEKGPGRSSPAPEQAPESE